jgi:cell division protein FtsB
MAPHKVLREAKSESTGLRRRVEQVYGQRRRFATVAAAVLAVALGYHVVFGQNGLTAYEKKKQDEKALQEQLKSLSEENDTRPARSCTTPGRAR